MHVLTAEQKFLVERVSKFVLFIYGKYFLQSMIPSSAPRLDLEFWESVYHFSADDPDLVLSVLQSIYRHMWYLSEELVILALCDKGTGNEEKEEIIKAMINTDRPRHFPPQKPVMKVHILLNKSPGDVTLRQFVGERSWLMIDLFDVEVEWMEQSPEQWIQFPSFLRFKEIIDSLKVVNDCAEGGVKDMTEFLNSSKDADQREMVQIVVNHHRQLLDFKNLSKAQIDNMDNFL